MLLPATLGPSRVNSLSGMHRRLAAVAREGLCVTEGPCPAGPAAAILWRAYLSPDKVTKNRSGHQKDCRASRKGQRAQAHSVPGDHVSSNAKTKTHQEPPQASASKSTAGTPASHTGGTDKPYHWPPLVGQGVDGQRYGHVNATRPSEEVETADAHTCCVPKTKGHGNPGRAVT